MAEKNNKRMMSEQTTQPGEARGDIELNEAYFIWLRALTTMIRIKAVWVNQAAPGLEALEKELEALPAGEERDRLTATLEGRYASLVTLWLHGLPTEPPPTNQ